MDRPAAGVHPLSHRWPDHGPAHVYDLRALQQQGVTFERAGVFLSLLFLAGVAIAWFGPETKGTTLAS
jgi:hypothetical protein